MAGIPKKRLRISQEASLASKDQLSWSDADDANLLQMVHSDEPWHRVSTALNRSVPECKGRYASLASDCNNPLLSIVAEGGSEPDSSSSHHSAAHVRNEWSVGEDLAVIEHVASMGTRWTQISRDFMPGRHPNSIKKRWQCYLEPLVASDSVTSKDDLEAALYSMRARTKGSNGNIRPAVRGKLSSLLGSASSASSAAAAVPQLSIGYTSTTSTIRDFSASPSQLRSPVRRPPTPPRSPTKMDIGATVETQICHDVTSYGRRSPDRRSLHVDGASDQYDEFLASISRQAMEQAQAQAPLPVSVSSPTSSPREDDHHFGAKGSTLAFVTAWQNLESAGWSAHTPLWTNVVEPPRCAFRSILPRLFLGMGPVAGLCSYTHGARSAFASGATAATSEFCSSPLDESMASLLL